MTQQVFFLKAHYSQIVSKNKALILTSLALVSILLFNAPLLSIFNRVEEGPIVPVLFLYLFGAWGVVILLVFWIVSSSSQNSNDDE